MDGALVGTLGIALSFQEKSVNEFLQEILKITSILNICIKHELMIRLITQIMHLNSVQKGLKLENQFFDYGHVVCSYREAQCLHYFLNHYSAQKTSEKLFISPKTVEFHLAKIKEKLNCYDTYQITQLAVNYGFIDLMFMRF